MCHFSGVAGTNNTLAHLVAWAVHIESLEGTWMSTYYYPVSGKTKYNGKILVFQRAFEFFVPLNNKPMILINWKYNYYNLVKYDWYLVVIFYS